MAERCQSWRYHPHAKHPVPPAPGGCRRCWSSCNKIAPVDSNRCGECFELLITNPNPEIRRAIALEPQATGFTLSRLADDHDYSVALSAMNVIELRKKQNEAIALRSETNPFSNAFGASSGLPWATK